MFSFWKSVWWSSPKKDGNDEIRSRANHEDKTGSTSSSQGSGKDGQGDGVAAREHVVVHSHDNDQVATESKAPTTLPRSSVVDELLKKPIDTTSFQNVTEAKAPTTPLLSSVIDESSEEPMDTDNGQVADEAEAQITPSRVPVVIELLEQTMETVTSTSEDSIVTVDSNEDWETMSNDAKQNSYVEWEMEERAGLAQYLVRQQKEVLERLKKAKAAGKVCRMPNKFWQKCAKQMAKMGYDKDDIQCSNQRLVICAFNKDEMKTHFGFDDEEADLLCGLWGRKKKQTKTPKKGASQATPRAKRYKESWMPDEETEFVSYLVRACKKDLQKMSEGIKVLNFFVGCEKHFNMARSKESYRNRARIMREYEDDILKSEHKLTDDEIELLRKPWLDRKKK